VRTQSFRATEFLTRDLRFENAVPGLLQITPSQFGAMVLPIAQGATEVDEVLLAEAESSDILSGTEWHLSPQPDGAVSGSVHFNLDEFEESTPEVWTAALKRILASAVRDPSQDWRQL